MADLRIVDAPVLLQESITDDVKMPTGGLGNYAIRLGDLVWYVVAKENLASKSYVDTSSKGVQDKLDAHTDDKNNPHEVTKEQVGLGNVDNTADVDKPVSNAVSSAIITATTDMATKAYVNQKDNLKADKATSLSGYGITDAYTKEETLSKTEIDDALLLKASVTYVDGKDGDLTTLTTTDKSSLVKAINEVYDKTAIFYNTVADMVADAKLKAGKAVITHGYYAPNDGGGARYLIKDTATDYSIPVSNNLHAVFADSFDIRKFGIRNNATLDQTIEIQRMVNYADTRVYEIDFLGYHIMSPKTVCRYYTGTRTGKGMGFSYVHKIKNLTISNDKTKTLMHGDTCIFFLPKENGFGNFVLDNVTFDPFVADYKILAGDGDGHMHGFSAEWHEDMQIGWPQNQQIQTGYNIIYNNINFISPAVCYNLSTNLRCNEIRITNAKGEYWGIYLWHWCDRLYAENVHGVWRDDLHANANPKRVLVTNLFQEEQEVGDSNFAYTQTRQEFKNISCIKKTDGSYYDAIVRQGMGKPTLKEFVADTVKGQIRWYMGQTTTQSTDYHILSATIKNCNEREFIFWCGIDSLKVYDCILQNYINSYLYTFNEVYFQNVIIPTASPFLGGIVNKFVGVNCDFTSEFGLIRGYPTIFNDIKLINPTVTKGWLIAGYAKKITIYGGAVKDNYFSKLIYLLDDGSTTPVPITIKGMDFEVDGGDGGHLIYTEGAKIVNAKVQHNSFRAKPNFVLGATGTLIYEYNSPSSAKTQYYDPPSLAAATQQSTNVTVSGAKVGDVVAVSFNQPLQGTRLWAEVTAADTVTVYHRNDTGAAVDLPSGTLTVKLI